MNTEKKINRRNFIMKSVKLFGALALVGVGGKSVFAGEIINNSQKLPQQKTNSNSGQIFFDYYVLEASDNSCAACKKHSENKRFRTAAFAEKNRCHKNCHCQVIKKQCSEKEYKIWFEHEDIADLRWARVKNKMIS